MLIFLGDSRRSSLCVDETTTSGAFWYIGNGTTLGGSVHSQIVVVRKTECRRRPDLRFLFLIAPFALLLSMETKDKQ